MISASRVFGRSWTALALLVSFGLACGLNGTPAQAALKAGAASTMEEKPKTRDAMMTGQIVAVTNRSISVEYDEPVDGADEALMPVNAETKVERVKGLAQLKPGDRVRVDYRQTYRERKDGERIILNTVALRIALLKNATQEGLRSNR